MDKEKELPTIEEFFNSKKKGFGDEVIAHSDVKKWMHEYAVLFAKWHRKEMVEAILKEVVIDNVQGESFVFKFDIENAYKEELIK